MTRKLPVIDVRNMQPEIPLWNSLTIFLCLHAVDASASSWVIAALFVCIWWYCVLHERRQLEPLDIFSYIAWLEESIRQHRETFYFSRSRKLSQKD